MSNGGGSPFGPFALAQGIGYHELVYKLNELHKEISIEYIQAHQNVEGRQNQTLKTPTSQNKGLQPPACDLQVTRVGKPLAPA